MRIFNESDQDTTIEFNIDQGARGVPGLPGPPGTPGDAATSSQVYISQAADMDMGGAVAGHFMRYDGSSFVLANMVLDDHLDVNVAAPNPGDAIVWNGTAWVSGSVSGGSGVYVLKGGDTMTGILDMTSHKVVNVTNPTNPQEAATKSYVDTTVIASGTLILSGAGIPGAGTGAETNYYVDTTNKALYGPKTGSTWPLNIKGLPSGGATNTVLSKSSATDYATGWNALPASSLTLTGSGPPVEATGTNGNYYSDTLSGILYGPKASVSYGPRIFQVTTNPSSGGIVSPSTGQLRIYRTGSDAVDYGPIMEQHLKIGSRIKLVTGGRTHAATISSGGSPSGAWTWVEIGLDVWPVTAWTNGETVVSNLNSATTGDAYWPVTVKLDNYAPKRRTIFDVTQTPYPLQPVDEDKFIILTMATSMVVTLPTTAGAPIPTGATFDFLWYGVGQPSFVAGSGASVFGTPGLKFRARYSVCTAIKTSSTAWVVYGDLAA